jgi:DNA repair exonuclease SbcCD nuclease subunit
MLKFIHTADLQIGMTAPGVGALAKQIQDARVQVLKSILHLASEKKVNFVLIAGDLFETNQVSPKSIQQVAMLLETAKPLRVFILPGNHDYYGPNSVYAHNEFRMIGSHVHVFTERKPLMIPDLDVTLYPNPCFESRSTELPMLWIKKEAGSRYHVAILHGSIPSRFGRSKEEDEYFPMDETALNELGMDYIALGHLHSLLPNPALEPESSFYYSGTPEPTGFGERLSGYALLAEFEDTARRVTPVPTAQFTFVDIQKTIAASTDIDALRSRLTALEHPSTTLVRVTLTGIISLAVREGVDQLMEEMSGAFAMVRLDDKALLLEPSPSDLERFVKGGMAHTTFALLKQKRDGADPAERMKYSRAISLAYKAFNGHLE